MTDYTGRLIVHDRLTHLEPYADTLIVGDTMEVVRGNGPREGDQMGTATITGFADNGSPEMTVRDRRGAFLFLVNTADLDDHLRNERSTR